MLVPLPKKPAIGFDADPVVCLASKAAELAGKTDVRLGRKMFGNDKGNGLGDVVGRYAAKAFERATALLAVSLPEAERVPLSMCARECLDFDVETSRFYLPIVTMLRSSEASEDVVRSV